MKLSVVEPRCLSRYSDRIDGPGFDFLQGQEIFVYFSGQTRSGGATLSRILSPGIKAAEA
jgi:hypothetical protein